MAARFISITNFASGQYAVDQNYFDATIVEKEEEKILRDLLGDYQYRLFIADCTGAVPATQKYKDLLNGKTYTNGYEIAYKGLTDMLVAFSFSALINQHTNTTGTGFTKNKNQNSVVLNKYENEQLANKAYNNGVNLYTQAQSFILFYNSDYPSWNTKVKNFRSLINY